MHVYICLQFKKTMYKYESSHFTEDGAVHPSKRVICDNYPLVINSLTLKITFFLEETTVVFQPLSTRVYVNLLEGTFMSSQFHSKLHSKFHSTTLVGSSCFTNQDNVSMCAILGTRRCARCAPVRNR